MAGVPIEAFPGRSKNSAIFHGSDGFHYNIREIRGIRVRLRCRQHKKNGLGCPGIANASLVTGLLVHSTPHNHEPDILLEEDFAIRRAIIEEAEGNVFGKKCKTLLNDWKLKIHNAELACRFTDVRMRSSIYSAMRNNYPPIPSSLLHLGILLATPGMRPICKTMDGNDLVFHGMVGTPHDGTLALIFASGRMLQFLQEMHTLFSDGTFRKRSKKPKMSQIFNIVTKYGDNIICLLRVLMSSRSTEAYRTVLQHLKVIAPNMNQTLKWVHSDFELAEMHAWQLEFPLAVVLGCLWHFAVAFSETAYEMGLAPLVKQDKKAFKIMLAVCAVPMLPSDRIWDGMTELWYETVQAGLDDAFRPLFAHFENYWLPRSHELSVYDMPDRTNNCAESDNRTLANVLPQNRPNIWHLISGFQKLEYLAWLDKLAIGGLLQIKGKRKWKTVWNDKTVKTATQLLKANQISLKQFLFRTSYAIVAAVRKGLHLSKEVDFESSDESDDSDV